MRIAIALTATLLFSSCAHSLSARMQRKVGTSIDGIVLMHGPASSQAQLSNGDRVYRWIFTGDTTSTFSGNANGGRAISSTSQCFLQFTVGSLGYISSWSHGGECHRNLIDDYRDESEKWRYCDHVDCL